MPSPGQTATAVEPASSQAASSDTAPIPSSSPPSYGSESVQQIPKPALQSRLAALQARKAALESQLSELQDQRSLLVSQTKVPSGLAMPMTWSEEEKTQTALTTAHAVVKAHITALHRYNEIKDIGQGLMGMVAEARGVRIADVMKDFGVLETD